MKNIITDMSVQKTNERILNPPQPPTVIHHKWTDIQMESMERFLGVKKGHLVLITFRNWGKTTVLREIIIQDVAEFSIIPIIIRVTWTHEKKMSIIPNGIDCRVLELKYPANKGMIMEWLEKQIQELHDSKFIIYTDECIHLIQDGIEKYVCSKHVTSSAPKNFKYGIELIS